MSIFDLYSEPTSRELVSPDVGRSTYTFDFSFLENSSIEVYEIFEIDGDEVRFLVSTNDYVLIANLPDRRYPVARGGTITFNRRHSVGVVRISIERNTLIDQTIDFPSFRTFNPRSFEIACDKATMIAQELVVRKCEAEVGDLDLLQKVTITQYDDFKGSVIQFMLDKITAILAAIAESAEDCRNEPERI